jgi:hypothetical protein
MSIAETIKNTDLLARETLPYLRSPIIQRSIFTRFFRPVNHTEIFIDLLKQFAAQRIPNLMRCSIGKVIPNRIYCVQLFDKFLTIVEAH